MAEITKEMREELRTPLPVEAVSQHPTKTYLSSIKSIYVAERISAVFGVGSWTLKSEVIERIDYQRTDKSGELKDVRFVVVKAVLEIPEYGFYGEAYGGNDNEDLGDAYKGATTDGFTKIAGQQLEIGIDVFKGIKDPKRQPGDKPAIARKAPPPAAKPPPLKNLGDLYTRAAKFGLSPSDVRGANGVSNGEEITDFDIAWKATATKFSATIKAQQESNK